MRHLILLLAILLSGCSGSFTYDWNNQWDEGGPPPIRVELVDGAPNCDPCRIAAIGDSITAHPNGTPYIETLVTLLPGNWEYLLQATSNTGTGTHKNGYFSNIDGQGYDVVVHLGGVVNMTIDQDGPTAFAPIQEMHTAAQAEGVLFVSVTVLPWGGWHEWTQARQDATNEDLDSLNELIRASPVLVVDGYNAFEGNLYNMRGIYDSGDGMHPNDEGQVELANEIAFKLLEAL